MSGPFMYAATQDLGLVDFRSGVLDPRLSHSGGAGGTYYNAAGVMVVSAGEPRFDHHPTTLKPLGLLVEPQRTNLLLHSQDFTNAIWAKSNITVTPDATAALDGTVTADKVEAIASTNTTGRYISAAATATALVYSIFVKKGNISTVNLRLRNDTTATNFATASLNLDTGAITGTGWTAYPYANGWFRAIFTQSTGITIGDAMSVYYGATSQVLTAGDHWYAWGAQLEAGAWASSYIPTTTATVTRSADVCSGTSSAFGVIDAEGTMYAEFSYTGGTSSDEPNNRAVLYMDNGATTNRHQLYNISSGTGGVTQVAGVTTGAATVLPAGVGGNGALLKAAYAYKLDDFQAARGGTAGAVDNSGTLPAGLARLWVGSVTGAAAFAGIHLRLFQMYPRRLSAAVLAKLTS